MLVGFNIHPLVKADPSRFCDFHVAGEIGHPTISGNQAGMTGFDAADEAGCVAPEDHCTAGTRGEVSIGNAAKDV